MTTTNNTGDVTVTIDPVADYDLTATTGWNSIYANSMSSATIDKNSATIQLGDAVITEELLLDLSILLEMIKDDPALGAQFNTYKAFNKLGK